MPAAQKDTTSGVETQCVCTSTCAAPRYAVTVCACSTRACKCVALTAQERGARGGGVEKHLECRSCTVSWGHFSTGTHGHLRLSHFLHDPDTFIEVRGRAARTRWNGSPGRTTPSAFTCQVRPEGTGRLERTIQLEYVCSPPGPTLMVTEWVRQLGGRLLLFLVLTRINGAY